METEGGTVSSQSLPAEPHSLSDSQEAFERCLEEGVTQSNLGQVTVFEEEPWSCPVFAGQSKIKFLPFSTPIIIYSTLPQLSSLKFPQVPCTPSVWDSVFPSAYMTFCTTSAAPVKTVVPCWGSVWIPILQEVFPGTSGSRVPSFLIFFLWILFHHPAVLLLWIHLFNNIYWKPRLGQVSP